MASPCRRSTFIPINCVRNAYSTEMPKAPLPPPSPSSHDLRPRNLPLIGFVIGASMLFGVFYMVIVRFFKKRPNLRERRLGNPTTTRPRNSTILFDAREEFIDEEQGPQLDHPIWYIHTVGLDQSAIDSIAAFRFKKGEGQTDGTDCSVCLTEFEDDEALRLLPKCSHVFHVACIDMWLRSHKNCPLCRAPVVAAAMADTAANSNPGNSRSDDGTRVSEVDGGEGEISGGRSITEIVVFPNEDAAVKELRRSVSMDASSSWDIYRSVVVAMNGVGRARVKKGKNLSLSSSSSRVSGSSFSLYRTMKKASVGSSVASSSFMESEDIVSEVYQV